MLIFAKKIHRISWKKENVPKNKVLQTKQQDLLSVYNTMIACFSEKFHSDAFNSFIKIKIFAKKFTEFYKAKKRL